MLCYVMGLPVAGSNITPRRVALWQTKHARKNQYKHLDHFYTVLYRLNKEKGFLWSIYRNPPYTEDSNNTTHNT